MRKHHMKIQMNKTGMNHIFNGRNNSKPSFLFPESCSLSSEEKSMGRWKVEGTLLTIKLGLEISIIFIKIKT